MAGKIRMPDLEPNAVRNVALIVSEDHLEPKSITMHLPTLKRTQLALVTCSTLQLIDATIRGWEKVNPTIRRDGSPPLKAQTRIIIVEVKNSDEIKRAKRRLKEGHYGGRVVFVCNKQRLSQLNKQLRQQVVFIGKQRCQVFAKLIESCI